MDDATAKKVKDLGLAGVAFVPESLRQYPSGSLASTILGRVGTEGYGLDGLESRTTSSSMGTPGEITVERDQRGRDIPDTERRNVPARPGTDLVLTVDEGLQYQVESSLVDQVTATAAKGGMAVVVDVHTGDVVAMATVDGATNGVAHAAALAGEDTNRPLTDLFEPGSTNKLITIATAIEHGKVGPNTEFKVPPSINVGVEKSYSDAHRVNGMEHWTTTDILRESSNVGTIMIAKSSFTKRARRRAPELRARQADVDRLPRTSRPGSCSIRRSTTRPASPRARSATASRSPRCRCSTCTRRSRTAG